MTGPHVRHASVEDWALVAFLIAAAWLIVGGLVFALAWLAHAGWNLA